MITSEALPATTVAPALISVPLASVVADWTPPRAAGALLATFEAPADAWATIGWSWTTSTKVVATRTAVMIRNAPPVIASAARFLPQPRRRSRSTSGRNVAASTMARTTGTTTSGTWMTTAITNPMSAAPTSSRQLHCATRSSQPGTRPVRSPGSVCSGSMTAMSAPATAVMKATTGTATNSPTIPATVAPAGSAMSTTAGWMWTVVPYTTGRTRLLRITFVIAMRMNRTIAACGPTAEYATSSTMIVVTKPPT